MIDFKKIIDEFVEDNPQIKEDFEALKQENAEPTKEQLDRIFGDIDL